ncbi:MAG: carboxypeptidase regulatory-like domain-containing protein [bacterium]|nr:carboxypeptidase regulatory-like domain-containing protein [bacterium]
MRQFSLLSIIVALVALIISACSQEEPELVPGQITVTGRITDAVTGEPLRNVIVFAEREKVRALTDEDGRYRLNSLQSQDSPLTLHRYGYTYALPPEPIKIFGEPRREEEKTPSIPGVRNFLMDTTLVRPQTSDTSYIAGYELGQNMAVAEFQNSDPCWYRNTMPPMIDELIGLPVRPMIGCFDDSHTKGVKAGHNNRVLQYIAADGLPELPHLWQYRLFQRIGRDYWRRAKVTPPQNLWWKGPSVPSPDSSVALRIIAPGYEWYCHYLEISRGDSAVLIEMPPYERDTLHVIWDITETDTVAIIRTAHAAFTVVDLCTGAYRQLALPKNNYHSPMEPVPGNAP